MEPEKFILTKGQLSGIYWGKDFNENDNSEELLEFIKIFPRLRDSQDERPKQVTEEEIRDYLVKEMTGSNLPPDFRNAAIYGGKLAVKYLNSLSSPVLKDQGKEPKKPLSEITDEDRNAFAEIVGSLNDDHLANALINGTKYVMDWKTSLELFQYLQSKNYELPIYFSKVEEEKTECTWCEGMGCRRCYP